MFQNRIAVNKISNKCILYVYILKVYSRKVNVYG